MTTRDLQPQPAMANLNDERRRALRLLARRLDGCAEKVLLAEGFTVGQLAVLVLEGLAETWFAAGDRRGVWIKITEAGRKEIVD
jgi:hypothetical protein